MKSKKVTMIAAALVVAVVALAGIGYATTYTAKTTNSGNTLETTYITMTQSGTGQYDKNFLKEIYYDTETVGVSASSTADPTVTTTYSPVCDYYSNHSKNAPTDVQDPEKTLQLASQVVGLTITPTTTNDATSVHLTVTATAGFSPITGLTYDLIIADSYSEGEFTNAHSGTRTDTTWDFGTVTINKTTATSFVVALFIGGNSNDPIQTSTACAGFATSGTTFVFTADATA